MAEILDCSGFHGLIHPTKKRLVGGYVGKWEADDRVGGGEGEDESQIWCKVMRLDPYQGEQAVDLSPLSHIFLFYLCSCNIGSVGLGGGGDSLALVYLWTNEAHCQRLYMTEFIPDNSRRLLVWCVLLFEGFDLCLECSMPAPHVGYGWPSCTSTGQLVHKMADCKSPVERVWQRHPEVRSTMRN